MARSGFPFSRAAVIAVVGAVATATACSVAGGPPATVQPKNLDHLLLSPQDINGLMDAAKMQPSDKIAHWMGDGANTFSNPDCRGTVDGVEMTVYQGSHFSAVSDQTLLEPGDSKDHIVEQAAVSFESDQSALSFVKNSATRWTSCAGQTVTDRATWTIGDVSGRGPDISVRATDEGDKQWGCQHALKAVSNVVIDVSACGHRISDQARRIVDRIEANVPQNKSSPPSASASRPVQTVLPFADLAGPSSISTDQAGNLYVTDTGDNQVVELPAGSDHLSVLPFTGLKRPNVVYVDSKGDRYLTDSHTNQVLRLPAGSTTQVALPFTDLKSPSGVTADDSGNVFVADTDNNRVLTLAPGSTSQTELPIRGLNHPIEVRIDSAGNVYVLDDNRALRLAAGSGAQTDLAFGELSDPSDLALDAAGNAYVANFHTNQVMKLAPGSSAPTELALDGLSGPTGVAVDAAGNVYVTDSNNGRVLKLAAR